MRRFRRETIMRSYRFFVFALIPALSTVVSNPLGAQLTDDPFGGAAKKPEEAVKQEALPQLANQLAGRHTAAVAVPSPSAFGMPNDEFKGWKVSVPGNHSLPTPAVVDGTVFIGGGFGSHEFYAFDAKTGKLRWQYQTKDDGPTAAVVQDGYVIFNTESCELEVLTTKGEFVWKKWLGDPLMSTPAISGGKVFMCDPDSKNNGQHYVACFEVKSGQELWKEPVAGEIITAPVIAKDQVYLASLEGTMYCFNQQDGKLIWQEKKNATSAPLIWRGQCYFSRREAVAQLQDGKKRMQQMECLAFRAGGKVDAVSDLKSTLQTADYLDFAKRQKGSAVEAGKQIADGAVGFGGGKGGAKISQAEANLGQGSVMGVWAYQGSKPFIHRECLYAAMGDSLLCVDLKTEKVIWKTPLHQLTKKDNEELLDSVVTPPALANDKLFVGTSYGDVICVSAASGQVLKRAAIGEPIIFQPAVVAGRVYVSTNTGSLYGLETGDTNDDGWLMWGATAAHNGLAD
jgi:Ca-activated chloride channel family protein